MPRRLRFASGGYEYHVLIRAVGRARLFRKEGDYAAFEKALRQAPDFQPMRLLAYCLMPNHWHLLIWPEGNPMRANLVARAQAWRWSSLGRWEQGEARWLSQWPEGRPGDVAPLRQRRRNGRRVGSAAAFGDARGRIR